MKKSLIILAAALAAFCACSQQPKLVILHTNDTHSHFEPLRGGSDDGVGGVIERAAYVDPSATPTAPTACCSCMPAISARALRISRSWAVCWR